MDDDDEPDEMSIQDMLDALYEHCLRNSPPDKRLFDLTAISLQYKLAKAVDGEA